MNITIKKERYSPLGNLILTKWGLLWEVRTPVYKARMPVKPDDYVECNGEQALVDLDAMPGFEMLVPKIPLSLLVDTVNFFRDVVIVQEGKEAIVYYTCRDNVWRLLIPDQINPAVFSVTGPDIVGSDNVGMQVHSHGRNSAYFSSIDDRSEVHGFLYGVVGNLSRPDFMTSYAFRAGHGGNYLPLKVHHVFDC